MAVRHTIDIAQQVCAQREEVLAQLQHAHPDDVALRDATAQDIVISLFKQQGRNKSTFHVKVADKDYILYVHTPPSEPHARQTGISLQREFQQHLRENGVPTPKAVGSVFTLSGIPYECELYEFCKGHTFGSFTQLGEAGIRDLATTIAKAHIAGADFHSSQAKAGFVLKNKGLPYGMTHNGLSSGNIIFDAHEHVAGLVDFSTVCYRPFVGDMVRVMKHFITTEMKDGKPVATLSEKGHVFLEEYEKTRPLTQNECSSLSWRMARKAFKDINTKLGADEKLPIADVSKATLDFQRDMQSDLLKGLDEGKERAR